MTVRSILVALLLLLAVSLPAHAETIELRTLWELSRDAELIVLAEVESVGKAEPKGGDSDGSGDVARLRVIEVWKGKKPERLEVEFIKDMVCPMPPRYERGLRVVAFLERSEGSWETTGLSYGTRYPTDDAAVEAYRQSVRMALEAQASSKEEQRVEWAVRTAVHPATRWDGLFTLDLYSSERKGARVSARHQKLLADAFIQAPPSGGTFALMLAVLKDYPSKAVDDTALSVMETTLQHPEEVLEETELAMKLIAERLGKPLPPPEPSKPQEAAARMKQQMKQQWESFKKANHLTPAPLRGPLSRGPSGGGGETPP